MNTDLLPANARHAGRKNRFEQIYLTSRTALEMDLPLEEIKGGLWKIPPFTAVTIHSKSGKTYPLIGFPAKKLQG